MKQEINRHDVLEKITPLIENTAMRFGYIPIEIEFVKENHRWFLRIYLYSKDKEVTLDDCENVTRSLSDFLDELIPVKYYLEVSSPGLERKFKSDKEFTYFNGRRISLKLKTPLEGEEEKIFKGEILDFNETDGLKFFRFEPSSPLTFSTVTSTLPLSLKRFVTVVPLAAGVSSRSNSSITCLNNMVNCLLRYKMIYGIFAHYIQFIAKCDMGQ